MSDGEGKRRAGRKPRCCVCGKETHENIRTEDRKRICGVCEKQCAWCGADDAPERDEKGARSCTNCNRLASEAQPLASLDAAQVMRTAEALLA